MNSRGDDVIGALAGELEDVFSEIGFDGVEFVVDETLVEMDLFAGHRLGFDDDVGALFLGETQDEIGGLFAVLGPDDFAAVGLDGGFELEEIDVEEVERVLFDGGGAGAEVLVFGATALRRLSLKRPVLV
jgi:hypothetical protein